MDYETLESAVSKPRAERYLRICKGNKAAAVDLYLFNIRHSQYFYPLLSMFEVVLRNSINTHYSKQLNDGDWLNSSIKQNGIFTNEVFRTGGFETKMQIQKAKRTLTKPYTHDRLVAGLSFGFWVQLFAKLQFRVAGQSLHKIFINRPPGTNQKSLFKSLCALRDFRNRIAHYEPICFNKKNEIDHSYSNFQYQSLQTLTYWLGFNTSVLFHSLDHICKSVQELEHYKHRLDFEY